MFKEIVWDDKGQEDGYCKDISDEDIKLKAASDLVGDLTVDDSNNQRFGTVFFTTN